MEGGPWRMCVRVEGRTAHTHSPPPPLLPSDVRDQGAASASPPPPSRPAADYPRGDADRGRASTPRGLRPGRHPHGASPGRWESGRCAHLRLASEQGHEAVVRLHTDRGADGAAAVTADFRPTPLQLAGQ
jgi:hypothetical protein